MPRTRHFSSVPLRVERTKGKVDGNILSFFLSFDVNGETSSLDAICHEHESLLARSCVRLRVLYSSEENYDYYVRRIVAKEIHLPLLATPSLSFSRDRWTVAAGSSLTIDVELKKKKIRKYSLLPAHFCQLLIELVIHG